MILAEVAAAKDWWENPILGPIIAGAALAALGYIATQLRKVLRSVQRTEDHVLPHFVPPHPGQPDTTVPGRLARLEEDNVEVRKELVNHMRDEVRLRDQDIKDRENRQAQLDKRLEAGAAEMKALRDGQADISRKIDDLREQ